MAILHRAVLLTGLLAVIAGIFGMHIMSGAHTMPTAFLVGTDMTLTQILGPHTGHGGHTAAQSPNAVTPAAPLDAAAPVSGTVSPCTTPGSCPAMAGMDAACVLSPANTSLSAPLPGTTPFPALDFTATALATDSYSYLPGTPSPGDLCISRT